MRKRLGQLKEDLSRLHQAFGIRFLLYLTINYAFVKGFLFQALTAVQLPYYQRVAPVSGEKYQKYYNVAMISFATKPLIGSLSDTLPIFGYHKRYYCLFFAVIGLVSLLLIQALPQKTSSAEGAAALFFFGSVAVSSLDLMCEGKYSEWMVKHPHTASTIVSWVWFFTMLGALVGYAIEGPVADHAGALVVLWIISPMIGTLIVPTVLGWLPEKKYHSTKRLASLAVEEANMNANTTPAPVSSERDADNLFFLAPPPSSSKKDKAQAPPSTTTTTEPKTPSVSLATRIRALFSRHAMKNKGLSALGVATSMVAIGLVIVELFANRYVVFAYVVVGSIALFVPSWKLLHPIVFKANLFMFLKELLYLQINGYLDYFYTAGPECIKNGPHFDYSYYQTFGQIVGSVGGILGVILFQQFLSRHSFRNVFWITTFIKIFASFFDLIIVNRWNLSMGIPDKVMFICGDAIIYQMSTMLDFMPAAVLISKLCPRGMEATMYALLAGFSALGQNISRTAGYLFAEALEIDTVPPCALLNLTTLIVCSHMILPVLIIPISLYLVPHKSMLESTTHETQPSEPLSPTMTTTTTSYRKVNEFMENESDDEEMESQTRLRELFPTNTRASAAGSPTTRGGKSPTEQAIPEGPKEVDFETGEVKTVAPSAWAATGEAEVPSSEKMRESTESSAPERGRNASGKDGDREGLNARLLEM